MKEKQLSKILKLENKALELNIEMINYRYMLLVGASPIATMHKIKSLENELSKIISKLREKKRKVENEKLCLY